MGYRREAVEKGSPAGEGWRGKVVHALALLVAVPAVRVGHAGVAQARTWQCCAPL